MPPTRSKPGRGRSRAPTRNACVRLLYERSRVPVRELARVAGVSERNMFALIRRLRCRPRKDFDNGRGPRSKPDTKRPKGALLSPGAERKALVALQAAVVRERAKQARRRTARERAKTDRVATRVRAMAARALRAQALTLRHLAEIDRLRGIWRAAHSPPRPDPSPLPARSPAPLLRRCPHRRRLPRRRFLDQRPPRRR